MPRIGVNALEIAFMSRSMPAQLNDIYLADRLKKLEQLIENMWLNLEKTVTGLSSMHSRVVQLERPTEQSHMNRGPTYASAMNGERAAQASTSQTVAAANTITSASILPLPPAEACNDSDETFVKRPPLNPVDFTNTATVSTEHDQGVHAEDGFQRPRHEIRQEQRLREGERDGRPARRVVVGTKHRHSSFAAAPEPSRDLVHCPYTML